MKIAIAVDGNMVSSHFGRSIGFMVIELNEDEIQGRHLVESPGHQPGLLPRVLKDEGVDCVITGGVGRRALVLFQEMGIEVISGATGHSEDILSRYLAGELRTTGDICEGGAGTCDGDHHNHHPEK